MASKITEVVPRGLHFDRPFVDLEPTCFPDRLGSAPWHHFGRFGTVFASFFIDFVIDFEYNLAGHRTRKAVRLIFQGRRNADVYMIETEIVRAVVLLLLHETIFGLFDISKAYKAEQTICGIADRESSVFLLSL